MLRPLALFVIAAPILAAAPVQAREFFVGGPVKQQDMEIVANYLLGIEMAPMPMTMGGMMQHGSGQDKGGGDMIHLEADIHATADNPYGYADGAWIPYLTVSYALKKDGSDWIAGGRLIPMTAKDGPHYANNLAMNGPGLYHVTYTIEPPAPDAFGRHIDTETGVPDWWKPITVSFDFKYPENFKPNQK
jgi:uncharacterized protein involved in high-affinity Fe2+ transport